MADREYSLQMNVNLDPFLQEITGEESARISDVRPLVGGSSREIYHFSVETDPQESEAFGSFVLRRQVRATLEASSAIETEYEIMAAAHEVGARVPRPYYQGIDEGGHAFFVMDYVDGETLAPRLFRSEIFSDARRKVSRQLGELLAPIHKIEQNPRLEKVLGKVPRENPARRSLEQCETAYRRIARDPHPVFELALRYLGSQVPHSSEVVLVHGDYRLGNVVFGPEGVRSILDWELAHWGDPMEDLVWPTIRAWRFGHDDKPVAGCGSLDELYEGYLGAGGRPVDRQLHHWWEVFCNLRWGVIILMQAAPFLDGSTRNLEKGAIGRRTAEVEAELLNLIRTNGVTDAR